VSRGGAALATASILMSCSRAPVPSEPASHRELALGSGQATSAPSSSFPKPSAAGSTRLAPVEGCTVGYEPSGGPEQRLAELAERCAAGMSPLGPKPEQVSLGANATGAVAFSIADASRCLRVFAVGTPGLDELELQLVSDSNYSYGIDSRAAPYAMVGADGVVCVKSPGVYRTRVRARHGSGSVSVRVYQAD
jgi:hypothetical protein